MKKGMRFVTVWDLLIWAYRDQKVGRLNREETGLGYGASPTAGVIRHVQLGTFIDGGRLRGASMHAHPDAEAVHGVLLDVLTGVQQRLVIRCAEQGQGPDLDVKYIKVKCVPVLRRNGKPVIIYDDSRNNIACEMQIVGSTPAEIGTISRQKRAEHALFVGALKAVEKPLCQVSLDHCAVQGLGVVARPWERLRGPRTGRLIELV